MGREVQQTFAARNYERIRSCPGMGMSRLNIKSLGKTVRGLAEYAIEGSQGTKVCGFSTAILMSRKMVNAS